MAGGDLAGRGARQVERHACDGAAEQDGHPDVQVDGLLHPLPGVGRDDPGQQHCERPLADHEPGKEAVGVAEDLLPALLVPLLGPLHDGLLGRAGVLDCLDCDAHWFPLGTVWSAFATRTGSCSERAHPNTGASARSALPVVSNETILSRPKLLPSWPRAGVMPPWKSSLPAR